MPHKHKRKRDDDISNFDLAPDTRAKPLAAYTKASIFSKEDESSSSKRHKPNVTKSKKLQDDTPKAFARLMARQSTGKRPNGLDDGAPKTNKKQRKQSQKNTDTTASQTKLPTSHPTTTSKSPPTHPPTTTPHPKILPGESLSTFSLRVDQTLPLTTPNPQNHQPNPTLPPDLQAKLKKSQRTTKHNKRLQRMQADWRKTETQIREKEASAADELEDQREEEDLLWSGVRAANNSRKGKKQKKFSDQNDDPWRDLEKRRREETRQKGLQDVVTAPPVLKKVKSKFKARQEDFETLDGRTGDGDGDVLVDVGDVPGRVGSLRRREELNATRKAVIEGYRKMQGKKRGVGERLSMARTVMT